MGELRIQDTGYIKATNEGTQATASNRANSGDVITLKNVEFIPVVKRNISANPELSSNTPSEVNLGSLENMRFKLRCLINMKTSADMAKVQHLLNCVSTNGYKLLWYNYTNATTDANAQNLVYNMALNSLYGHQTTDGEKSAFTITDNFYHLHVILHDSQWKQVGNKSLIMYEFSGIVLPVETSGI